MTWSPMILMRPWVSSRVRGAAIWSYAVRHPNTTLGAVAGFVLAVLVLTLGLWDTLVIAFFVLIGAVIGQIRDGENGIVNFFGRLFSGR